METRTQDWLERLRAAGLLVDPHTETKSTLGRLATDSREVRPGDCFVAIRGVTHDGHMFIDKAVQNGATVLVCEAAPAASAGAAHTADVLTVRVHDSRRALAELVSFRQGDPADELDLYAVTGTNGKTTTATLIAYAVDALSGTCGFIGTTGYRIGAEFHVASHTTPSPIRVYELLRAMANTGCTACAMEASSHALDQWRILPRHVDVAVFTNLTRDHLDYHGSFDAYLAAKRRLFEGLQPDAVAVLNADAPAHKAIAESTRARVLTFGTNQDADIRYRIHGQELSGLDLEIDGMRGRFRLGARYNASNLAAAYAALRARNIEAETLFETLRQAPPVAGRFERLLFTDRTVVIVDYAHTPDALENVLEAARAGLAPGTRLLVVFGCGGDRDAGKRPEMGAIAERLADRVVVTSDNPRFEDPDAILEDIRAGMDRPADALWIADRAEAIRAVAREAAPGDAVVIAGKGHETYQVIGERNVDFDDRIAAREAFEATGRTLVQAGGRTDPSAPRTETIDNTR